jgi:ABC-2 type transport system permease protein
MISKISYYLKIWWLMSRNSFQEVLVMRRGFLLFVFAKVVRFLFFFGFLFFLLQGTKTLAGYNQNQVIFFFLTFNVVDIFAQFLFREVYRFRPLIVSGDFDLVLSKPINPLFRSLMGGADIIDLTTIVPLLIAVYYVGNLLSPTSAQVVLYLVLIVISILIAMAFHIAVLALGIITLEIDHTILIYRDIKNLGRLPIDIYKQPLQAFLTYLIPIGMMITFPAKALMGLLSASGAVMSLIFACVSIFLSIKFWNFALTKYTSASS